MPARETQRFWVGPGIDFPHTRDHCYGAMMRSGTWLMTVNVLILRAFQHKSKQLSAPSRLSQLAKSVVTWIEPWSQAAGQVAQIGYQIVLKSLGTDSVSNVDDTACL